MHGTKGRIRIQKVSHHSPYIKDKAKSGKQKNRTITTHKKEKGKRHVYELLLLGSNHSTNTN
jgi:hypothetical protein